MTASPTAPTSSRRNRTPARGRALGSALIGALALAACATAPATLPANDLVYKESPHSVAVTLDRLTAAATAKGATVFARVPHAKGAAASGYAIGDSELLIFGNPAIGSPLLALAPTSGVDLPLRVLAMEDEGRTYLVYTSAQAIARRHGAPVSDPAILSLAGALDALTDAATAP